MVSKHVGKCRLNFFIPWPFMPKGYCHCLCLSVWFVRMIIHHRFGLESLNVHQICILVYSWLVWKMGVIDLDLQVNFDHFDSRILGNLVCCVITCNKFELESPNLHMICILGFYQLVLKMEVIDLYLQGHLVISRIQSNVFQRHSCILI